jgi:UDP-3-O-[3-hydroxymyristoyl] glucosamine N-acyltransferase
VFASIDAPGYYSSVTPLQPYREWQKTAAQLRQLARLRDRVLALEQALRSAVTAQAVNDGTQEDAP